MEQGLSKIKETIFEAETQEQLSLMMTQNCLKEEVMAIKKVYSEQELAEMRREYARNAVEVSLLMDEFNKFKTEIQNKIKEPKKTNEYILNQLRDGFSEVNQQVFLFDFQEEGTMGYYDANGKKVYERPLMPAERQTNIVSITR